MASPPPRDRSTSPAQEPPSKKSKSGGGGFKWKEKRPRDSNEQGESRNQDRLERGYRDRYERDDRRPPASERREDDRHHDRRSRSRSPRRDRDGGDRWRPSRDDADGDRGYARDRDGRRREDRRQRESDGGARSPVRGTGERRSDQKDEKRAKKKKDKPAQPPPSAGLGEPMIVVNVNDRLGTKAAIPCLASDSIKVFKAMVAAQIGRQPHEILLKRQGERPFKDQLSLQDYGVSNGIQLDLELNTGD